MSAFLHTSSVQIRSALFARALPEVGLFNFTASPVCRGVFGGVRACAAAAAVLSVLERVCVSWQQRAFSATVAAAAADPSHLLRVTGIEEIQVRCLICETMRGKKAQGREAAVA